MAEFRPDFLEPIPPDVPETLQATLRRLSRPLRTLADLDPLLARIGQARFVLIGEASHGTHEFYRWRADLTKRLITERGFTHVAVEGDWPDAARLNGYVQGRRDSGRSATAVLMRIARWPTWMWANAETVAFADWLRGHNATRPEGRRVGFYGMDVYSLWDSLQAVFRFLQQVDPSALFQARRAARCFEPFGTDAIAYARASVLVPTSCEDEVVNLLVTLRTNAWTYAREAGLEAYLDAEQNAHVVQNAEAYYRTMVRGGPASWNLRDTHMVETLERLIAHGGETAKAVVWAHNTHIGDARATDMAAEGMVNLGELLRLRQGSAAVVAVGMSTHRGHVIAADAWDEPMRRLPVPRATHGSWEDVLHRQAPADQWLLLDPETATPEMLVPRGHRAIGVVYHPAYERFGNYVPTVLPCRYDALLHFEHTEALTPLHVRARLGHEPPETYPWAV